MMAPGEEEEGEEGEGKFTFSTKDSCSVGVCLVDRRYPAVVTGGKGVVSTGITEEDADEALDDSREGLKDTGKDFEDLKDADVDEDSRSGL